MKTHQTTAPIYNLLLQSDQNHPLVIAPTTSFRIDLYNYRQVLGDSLTPFTLQLERVGTTRTQVAISYVVSTTTPFLVEVQDKKPLVEGELYVLSLLFTQQKGNFKPLMHFDWWFAVNYNLQFSKEGMKSLAGRKMLVCISDIHLGAYDQFTECRDNRKPLEQFLATVGQSPDVRELVIAGDLVDEWFIPAPFDTFQGKTQDDFVKAVKANNAGVFDQLEKFTQQPNKQLTYVPGNHDLLITQDELKSVLPHVVQARDVDAQGKPLTGLGSYSPKWLPEAVIEHGHRYNLFCAPYYYTHSTLDPQAKSILPPGYFFTRLVVDSVINNKKKDKALAYTPELKHNSKSQYLCLLYANTWKDTVSSYPIAHSIYDPYIVTHIDGLTATYACSDLFPMMDANQNLQMNLYAGIQDNWDDRQTKNKVAVKISTSEALQQVDNAEGTDYMAYVQYFNNPASDKRIVLFGHSHVPRIISSETNVHTRAIYANTGTWIDHNNDLPTMTFVALIPPPEGQKGLVFVNLYQYLPSGEISLIDSQALQK